jgi:hypothetical protein
MYDTIDGKKAGILKDVDTTYLDSTYVHKDSQTIGVKTCVHCSRRITDGSRYYTDGDKPVCKECWDNGD